MAPQSNHVLLCSNCKTFQAQIVKKSNKWECKICGVKQTVLKVFGEGTGADCRQIVGKLNFAKGVREEEAELNKAIENHNRELEEETQATVNSVEENSLGSGSSESVASPQESKWSVFENTDHRNRLDW